MATGTRIRYNLTSGTLGAELATGATTIDFGGDPGFATLAGGEYIAITIDPAVAGEIVHLTGYTSGGTTGTIQRAQEGTIDVTHSVLTDWVHGPTTQDFSHDEIDDVSVDDHHTQDHAARHGDGGADAITITESQVSDLSHLTIEQVQDNLGTGALIGGNNLTLTYSDVANTITLDVDILTASDITSGTFADARISQSSVTQHQSSLSIVESQVSDLVHYTTSDFNTDLGASNLDALNNVVISTVATDDVLTWNGSNWVNQPQSSGGLVETGSYVGDDTDKVISVSFDPTYVLVMSLTTSLIAHVTAAGAELFITGNDVSLAPATPAGVTTGGFNVDTNYLNRNSETYYWVALAGA